MTANSNGTHLRPVLPESDLEWVAELIDTMREGDVDVTVDILEGLLRRLRKASKARRALTQVPAPVLRKALELRAPNAGGEPCP